MPRRQKVTGKRVWCSKAGEGATGRGAVYFGGHAAGAGDNPPQAGRDRSPHTSQHMSPRHSPCENTRGHSHTPGWTHTDAHTQTSVGECTHTHTHTRLCVYAPTCARARLHGSVLTCMNTRACCVCTHVHAHTHARTGSGASLLWCTHTHTGLYCGHRAPRHGTAMLGSRTGAPRRLEGPGLFPAHGCGRCKQRGGPFWRLHGCVQVCEQCANSSQCN